MTPTPDQQKTEAPCVGCGHPESRCQCEEYECPACGRYRCTDEVCEEVLMGEERGCG